MSAPVPASAFPISPSLSGAGGDLVQSLTYRETYAPTYSAGSSGLYDPPVRGRLLSDAPGPFRTAAGAAWALVSVTAAGCVLVVLVLLAVRIVGWLA